MGKLIYHLCAVKISEDKINTLLLEGSGRTATYDLDIQLHTVWNAALLDIL